LSEVGAELPDVSTRCHRCLAARNAARWCEVCGLDFAPEAGRAPTAESFAADARERRWFTEHPDDAEQALAAYQEAERAKAASRAGRPEPRSIVENPAPSARSTIDNPIRPRPGQRFTLDSSWEEGYLLREEDGSPVGRVIDSVNRPPVLEDAQGTWVLEVRKRRLSWQAVAHRPQRDQPLAAYYPSWLGGGTLWLSSDRWYALRGGRRSRSLKSSDQRPVAQLQSSPDGPPSRLRLELLEACDQPSLPLLVLFSCWLVLLEDTMWVPVGGG
jgi:hypothetical protein